jgi:hypothetical protein
MAKRPRQANRAGIPVLPLPYTRFGVLRNMACRLWSYECELEEVREFVGRQPARIASIPRRIEHHVS